MSRFSFGSYLVVLALCFGVSCQSQEDAAAPADTAPSVATPAADYTALQDASHDEIQSAILDGEARLTIVNMWATWCAPCVKEFPYFIEVDRLYEDEGVEVVFVSTDFEEQKPEAEAFLEKQGWTGSSFFKTSRDHAFINAFSTKWSGALPATFIYDKNGSLVEFWEGDIQREELLEKVARLLETQSAS